MTTTALLFARRSFSATGAPPAAGGRVKSGAAAPIFGASGFCAGAAAARASVVRGEGGEGEAGDLHAVISIILSKASSEACLRVETETSRTTFPLTLTRRTSFVTRPRKAVGTPCRRAASRTVFSFPGGKETTTRGVDWEKR